MEISAIMQLIPLLAAFAGIVWGVLKFFLPPSRRSWKTIGLAATALLGVANQATATSHVSDEPVRTTVAVATYLVSIWLFWSAVRACRHPLTAIYEQDVPIRLVATGPYSLIRHPFYASYSLFWLAGWIGTSTWSTAVIAAVMVTVYLRAACSEEAKFAASPLRQVHEQYRERTGFFLPRFRNFPASPR